MFFKGQRVFVESVENSDKINTMINSVNDGKIYEVTDVSGPHVRLDNGFYYHNFDLRHAATSPYKNLSSQEPQLFNINHLL